MESIVHEGNEHKQLSGYSYRLITIIIPLYNEEENVETIAYAIKKNFVDLINIEYRILFVDDGSTDKTLNEIKSMVARDSRISFLSFSRNFGKDVALLAGFQQILENVDAVITIDADLQHPPELIPELIRQWQLGYDIVYAYREEKNQDASLFFHLASSLFYRLISLLTDIKMENGLSDYKIIDKKVIPVIQKIKEDAPFLRGLLKWVGYKQSGIPYSANSRLKGKSKYPTGTLIKLALHNITSFSTKPLTIAIYIGFLTSFIAVMYIPYVLYSLYAGYAIAGWPSTIATIAFFGGIQLIILGIIGLYLGKIFIQSKERPQYIINESNLVAVSKYSAYQSAV